MHRAAGALVALMLLGAPAARAADSTGVQQQAATGDFSN
jgi:hypothetical protein